MVLVLYSAKALAMDFNFMVFFFAWISGFYILSGLTIDNYSKWDLYAASLPVSKRSFLSVLVPAEVLIFPQAAVCIHFRPPAALAADDWQIDALRCQPRITRICLKANDIQRYITKIAVKQPLPP